jgi:hypothetical protein
MGVGNNDAGRQDAKHVTRLPFTVAGGPLPAIALGIIILVFLLVVVLYAFL